MIKRFRFEFDVRTKRPIKCAIHVHISLYWHPDTQPLCTTAWHYEGMYTMYTRQNKNRNNEAYFLLNMSWVFMVGSFISIPRIWWVFLVTDRMIERSMQAKWCIPFQPAYHSNKFSQDSNGLMTAKAALPIKLLWPLIKMCSLYILFFMLLFRFIFGWSCDLILVYGFCACSHFAIAFSRNVIECETGNNQNKMASNARADQLIGLCTMSSIIHVRTSRRTSRTCTHKYGYRDKII